MTNASDHAARRFSSHRLVHTHDAFASTARSGTRRAHPHSRPFKLARYLTCPQSLRDPIVKSAASVRLPFRGQGSRDGRSRHRRRGESMDKGTTVVSASAVEVAMRYRDDIEGDAGLCIQVYTKGRRSGYGAVANRLLRQRAALLRTGKGRRAFDARRDGLGRPARLDPRTVRAGPSQANDRTRGEDAVQAALPDITSKAHAIVAAHTT